MKKTKIILSMLLILVTMVSFAGCGKDNAEGEELTGNKFVKITMEDNREIIIEVMPGYAPMTAEFFIEVVKSGYYDGLVFHRAHEGFVVQGGSPNGDGVGGCGRTVKGEFASNGIQNDLSHQRGVVSLARTEIKDSASGQFFIMHGDDPSLDGNYAAFGRVVEGMDVVDEIATRPVSGEMLIDKPVMKKVEVLKNYGIY